MNVRCKYANGVSLYPIQIQIYIIYQNRHGRSIEEEKKNECKNSPHSLRSPLPAAILDCLLPPLSLSLSIFLSFFFTCSVPLFLYLRWRDKPEANFPRNISLLTGIIRKQIILNTKNIIIEFMPIDFHTKKISYTISFLAFNDFVHVSVLIITANNFKIRCNLSNHY